MSHLDDAPAFFVVIVAVITMIIGIAVIIAALAGFVVWFIGG